MSGHSGVGSSTSTSGTDEMTNALRSTVLHAQMRPVPDDAESFLNPQLFRSARSPLNRTSSSSSVPTREQRSTACRCLEQHTELLRHLKGLLQGQVSLDNVLTAIQRGLGPWQNLIHCTATTHDEDHSVLVLSLMSMRVLLRHLQQICLGTPSLAGGQSVSESSAPALGLVTTGGYRPTQNEQRHITDLLLFHALRKMKYVLNTLRAKFAQHRGPEEYHAGEGSSGSAVNMDLDVDNIPPLFEMLDRSLGGIFSAVRNRTKNSSIGQD